MSSLIAQLLAPVHTLKYFSEPEECCSTCKQSMPSTMSIFVKHMYDDSWVNDNCSKQMSVVAH